MNAKEHGTIEKVEIETIGPYASLSSAEKCAAVTMFFLLDKGNQKSFFVLIDDFAEVSRSNSWR
jgi:hypothetical protein